MNDALWLLFIEYNNNKNKNGT